VIEGNQSRLAVECDGDDVHGADRYEQDMERQRILERCGWVFYRVRASAFYMDPAAALSPLWKLLEDRGILPSSVSPPGQSSSGNQQGKAKPDIGNSVVKVGDTVRYIDLENPGEFLETQISRSPSNPEYGIVNERTPIARALLGARVGEQVEANLPTGKARLKVIEILCAT